MLIATHADGTVYWEMVGDEEALAVTVAAPPALKPPPEVPPPVWDARPIDAQRAMDAVRAMCG